MPRKIDEIKPPPSPPFCVCAFFVAVVVALFESRFGFTLLFVSFLSIWKVRSPLHSEHFYTFTCVPSFRRISIGTIVAWGGKNKRNKIALTPEMCQLSATSNASQSPSHGVDFTFYRRIKIEYSHSNEKKLVRKPTKKSTLNSMDRYCHRA